MDPARAHARALDFAYKDFPLLEPSETVRQALDKFRRGGVTHKIIYLYVVDGGRKLLGVLPTRTLLASDLDRKVEDLFIPKVVALPCSATMGDAQDAFSKHQFLAFPIVDPGNAVLGVLDIQPFTGDLHDVDGRTDFDDLHELLGLQTALRDEASARLSFKMRFPWLISTIVAGSIGAYLTSLYEATLQEQIALAFFLTMSLGLNESVCMQAATLAIQRLHAGTPPGARALAQALYRELRVALLLGLACGAIVAAIVVAWRGDRMAALSIGLSLLGTIAVSCLWGVVVPVLLRKLQKDPKVAAAPIALAFSDVSTLAIYFGIASWVFASAG